LRQAAAQVLVADVVLDARQQQGGAAALLVDDGEADAVDAARRLDAQLRMARAQFGPGRIELLDVVEAAELGHRRLRQIGLGIEAGLVVHELELLRRGRAQDARTGFQEARVVPGQGSGLAARHEDVDALLAAEFQAPLDVGCRLQADGLAVELMGQARRRCMAVGIAVDDGETAGGIGLADQPDRGVDGRKRPVVPDAHEVLQDRWTYAPAEQRARKNRRLRPRSCI
jgi:hypothetical protein